MKITNSDWKSIRDGLSKFPHSYVVELRGVLNYLIETYAAINTDSSSVVSLEDADLQLPNRGIRIPSFYSDLCASIVLHELIETTRYHLHEVSFKKSHNSYKVAFFL